MNPVPSADPVALARLWPNRTHESNWVKAVLCALGLHRWHLLQLTYANGKLDCRFCRWCPKVRVGP